MGSARAKAWLFTLSTGAPDLDVQEQAAAALSPEVEVRVLAIGETLALEVTR